MRTYVAKGREAEELQIGKNWYVVDAEGQVLGRPATRVARIMIEDGAYFKGSLEIDKAGETGDASDIDKPAYTRASRTSAATTSSSSD